jgi:hypothetical protein
MNYMKNIKKLALIVMSLTLFTACSNGPKSIVSVDRKESDAIVNKIHFEEVKIQDLKPSIKGIFESKKQYRGYFNFKDEDGYLYIGIFSGKRNTGGYSIKVLNVEDIEGKTGIIVQETSPKPSDYVTQALTYPYTVIRVKAIAKSIVVKNTSGEEFKDIKNSGGVL